MNLNPRELLSVPGGLYLAAGLWAVTRALAISEASGALAVAAGLSGVMFGFTVRSSGGNGGGKPQGETPCA